MSKVKLLGIIVIGLLVSNLMLVGFIYFKKPNHPRPEGPKNLIIEKLNFDDVQIKKYEVLIKWHRHEIKKSEEEMMGLKKQLYGSLSNNSTSERKDSIVNEIGKIQIKIENIHYLHFEDIKKLCTKNQMPAFDELTEELASLFAKPPPGKHKR